MTSFQNDDLIDLLSHDQANLRMLALHQLCEGYADQSSICELVFSGWDRWGAAEAFSEFPMLSYLAVPPEAIEECCHRAEKMVERRALTTPESRCAGKLIEQVVTLQARDLQSHLALLESITTKSKIFFRVDLQGVRERLELLSSTADQLAGILDESVQRLSEDANDVPAVRRGLQALGTLRREHPEYLDLAAVLADSPGDSGPGAMSFQLTLQSLIQFGQSGSEVQLSQHLLDHREAVCSAVVEALVRVGTRQAGEALIDRFTEADGTNRKWIARALQRLRAEGLAPQIAQLRAGVSDPTLWLMLLIAEVRQLEEQSGERIGNELKRLQSYSEALIDSLTIFCQIHDQTEGARKFQGEVMEYLQRANQQLGEQLSEKKQRLQRTERRKREQQRKQAVARYRKEK